MHAELVKELTHALAADDRDRAAAGSGPAGSAAVLGVGAVGGLLALALTGVLEALVALGDLQAHVGDVKPRDLARVGEHGGGELRSIGVQVHLQRGFVAHHEHRVPELLERSDEAARGQAAARDREVRAEAVGGRAVLRVRDARGRVVVERRRVIAAQRRDHAGDDDRQPVAAGIDDPSLAQRCQQLGAALDRKLAGDHCPLERIGDRPVLVPRLCTGGEPRVRTVRDVSDDLVRHLARDREDRPLRRLAYRRVRAVGGVRERGADQRRVDQLAGPRDELLGCAAYQLREDHAGVAASAEQRRASHRLNDLLASYLVDRTVLVDRHQAVELVAHCAQGERHVVARVAVGDREHVEVVDLLAARFQVRESPLDGRTEADQVRVGHSDTSITFAARRKFRRPRGLTKPW